MLFLYFESVYEKSFTKSGNLDQTNKLFTRIVVMLNINSDKSTRLEMIVHLFEIYQILNHFDLFSDFRNTKFYNKKYVLSYKDMLDM